MFDYSNNLDSGSKCWLHEKELGQIHRGLFTRDALIKSWSCYSGELFVKSWYQATGSRNVGGDRQDAIHDRRTADLRHVIGPVGAMTAVLLRVSNFGFRISETR